MKACLVQWVVTAERSVREGGREGKERERERESGKEREWEREMCIGWIDIEKLETNTKKAFTEIDLSYKKLPPIYYVTLPLLNFQASETLTVQDNISHVVPTPPTSPARTLTYLAAVRDVLCRDGGPRLLLLAIGRLYLAAIAFRNLAPGAPQRVQPATPQLSLRSPEHLFRDVRPSRAPVSCHLGFGRQCFLAFDLALLT